MPEAVTEATKGWALKGSWREGPGNMLSDDQGPETPVPPVSWPRGLIQECEQEVGIPMSNQDVCFTRQAGGSFENRNWFTLWRKGTC